MMPNSTVASAAFTLLLAASELLMPATAGAQCTVTNTGANTIDIKLWVGDSGVGIYGLDGPDCNESYSGTITVGLFFGGDGTLTVENGATLTGMSILRTAYAGNVVGNTMVRSGAQVSAVDCEVSSVDGAAQDSGTGVMTVTGVGTNLSCADELQVGYDGPGTLEVSDMATVSAARLTSAFEGPGEAILRVTSGATVEITGSNGACHTFGVRKTGLLDVDGGTLAFSDPNSGFLCTCTVGGACSVEVRVANGGLLTTEGGILTQNDTTVTLAGGTVELPEDTGSGGGSLSICSGTCVLQGDGTVSGELLNAGDLLPGLEMGIGRIDVVADPARSTTGAFSNVVPGALVMEIASEESYDELVVEGDFSMTGNLQVRFIDGYEPALGTSFEIASAGGVLDYSPNAVQFFGLSPELVAEASVAAIDNKIVVTVPAPDSGAAGSTALSALALLRRRRRGTS